MKLEEAVNKLKANIKTPRFAYTGVNGEAVCVGMIAGSDVKEVISTILQELEHLQKENEELKKEIEYIKEDRHNSAEAYKDMLKEQQRYYEERME